MVSPLHSVFDQTWAVVAPVSCAGCGQADVQLCDRCRRELRPHLVLPTLAIRRALFGLPVIAGIPYRGVAKRVITAYKDRGIVALRQHLSWPLRAAWHHLGQLVSLDGVTVVCVPHARRAWLTRGRHPTWELIRYARLPGVRLSGPLTLRHEWSLPRYASPQKSLTRRQRLHHPPRMVSTAALDARRVVLVDDVLTTGMSLEYAARALEAAGALIVGAVVVAATPSRHHLT